ncbi:unnamed protein product, partial [Meganyctiphanes norvegica]
MELWLKNKSHFKAHVKILSRAKPALGGASANQESNASKKKSLPKLEDFLNSRDYTGAITLLEFERSSGNSDDMTDSWIGYCGFHLGDYKRALKEFQNLTKPENMKIIPENWINLACCYFFLGMYPEAEEASEKSPKDPLRTRLFFHLAHKFNDEKRLMMHHQQLEDVIEDQLSLASIHYLRSHYQEAIDIYKRILLDNREYLALNVYVALCYYKLDYYDVSQEVLAVYLQHYPDSPIAINLKACNHFKLYNGKAAEQELRALQDVTSSPLTFAQDLVRHNLVVFRGGEGALQVLPPLVDVIPEARLNLVIYYLKQDEIHEAYNLLKDLEPTVPQEYILKGVVNAAIGQEQGSHSPLKYSTRNTQIKSSGSNHLTIPGGQVLILCFLVLPRWCDIDFSWNFMRAFMYLFDNYNFRYNNVTERIPSNVEEACMLIKKIGWNYAGIKWCSARCSEIMFGELLKIADQAA